MIDIRSTIPLTNYGLPRFKAEINTIVFHHIVGDAPAAINRFKTPGEQASSTYVIGSGGEVYYVVSESRTPYTNGSWYWNRRSITIEHAGGHPNVPYTEEMYKAAEDLVRSIRKRYNIKNFKRHREISSTICPGALDVERIVRNSNPKIEEEDMVSEIGVYEKYRLNLGRSAEPAELNQYVGKVNADDLTKAIKNSREFDEHAAAVKANPALAKNHLPAEMR